MSSNLLLRREDLINNPTARVPVCLCLDVSGSMNGAPIKELNDGVRLFYEAIKTDETAFYSAEISIIAFGENSARCIQDFSSLTLEPNAPVLTASGGTPMGEAINLALDMLESRKSEYSDSGVDYYQPWLVVMTDGQPNGNIRELETAIMRTTNLIVEKKLTIFPIGIGEDADMDVLTKLSPKRPPLRLRGLNFREFFSWLSKSVARVSASTPGENVKLDLAGISSWGEI
jgi:hypothetical protein